LRRTPYRWSAILTLNGTRGRRAIIKIARLADGESAFALGAFSPPMIVNILAFAGLSIFIEAVAQKTNMFVNCF
jgi:hypothetical protein